MPLILPSNTITGGYEVANSVRLDTDATFTRTLGASPTDADVGTVSFWFKKVETPNSSKYGRFVHIGSTGNDLGLFTLNDYILWYIDSGTAGAGTQSGRLYRDQSAWYHIIYAFDSRQATASNRIKIYVNGELQDSTAHPILTNVTSDTAIFDASHLFCIGATNATSLGQNLDGYLAEFVYVDGQQLDATSFGEFDEDSGIWKPIDVSGLTFGNNGFYLDFENSGSLGADVSGNGNNFTVNNLTSVDQSTDTPTNNYCTINPLDKDSNVVLADGNLTTSPPSANNKGFRSTFAVSQGKWYWEVKWNSGGGTAIIGIADDAYATSSYLGSTSKSWGYYNSGDYYNNASTNSYGNSFTSGDIIGVALDADNGYLYFSKNGTFQNSGDPTSGATGTGGIAVSSPSNGLWFPAGSHQTGTNVSHNFGSPPYSITSGNSDGAGYGNFEYSVPSGYYALNTKNLAEYG